MSETRAKHTPGPWTVEWDSDGDEWADYGEWVSAINGPDGKPVVSAIDLEDTETLEANAYLIAAAPTLYETAKSVYRILDGKWTGRRSGFEAAIIASLKRAIDKVEERRP